MGLGATVDAFRGTAEWTYPGAAAQETVERHPGRPGPPTRAREGTGPRLEVSVVKLERWWPPFDMEKEWDTIFRLPRLVSEGFELPFRPAMDVTRTDGTLVVTAELPGIDPDKDIEITVDDEYLTIEGEKSEETEVSEDDRFIRERKHGKFVRRIPVPEGVDPEQISAGYAKGILTVRVTLPEEVGHESPKRIVVDVAQS